MERTIDLLARELGLDPAEIRRRNFIPSEAFPYTTATGLTYDSGNFMPALEQALELADYASLRQAQKGRGIAEPLLGVGLATVVKASGGSGEMKESHALVRVEPTGLVTVYTGLAPRSGAETTFAQIVADEWGCALRTCKCYTATQTCLPQDRVLSRVVA
jgi:carbon-monoxide dehydrogenase large subunit